MASTKVVVFDVIYNSAVEGSDECTKRSTNISPRSSSAVWRASGARWGNARWRPGLGCGGGTRARAEEGHGSARWRPHEEEDGGAGVTEGERTRREEEEGGGVRRGRRRADRSAPGAGGYISERITPGASHQPGVKTLYSRCVLPTGSKGLFTPGACYQPGVKVPLLPVRLTNLYSRLVTRTGSKEFFLAGHETAGHLYSRVGFPPGSKGGLQFRFPPVLSNSLVKYNRNAIVFVKYIVN